MLARRQVDLAPQLVFEVGVRVEAGRGVAQRLVGKLAPQLFVGALLLFDLRQRLPQLGVALLPRRCAITEIASGRLVAVPVAGVSRKRQLMLVCRRSHRSHAANAFLAVAQENGEESLKAEGRSLK